MGTASDVVVAHNGPLLYVTLNRPDVLNALGLAMRNALAMVVDELERNSAIRACVLTGTGRAFCAGGDVQGMVGITAVEERARMREVHGWLGRLLNLEKPVVTAVNGIAVGAGVGLALTGDIVLAADTAYFSSGFFKVGALPDMASLRLVARHIGLLRAKRFFLMDQRVSAEEAQQLGLVTQVVQPNLLMSEAGEVALRLAAGPRIAISYAKRMLNQIFETDLDTFFLLEELGQGMAIGSTEGQEGLQAFLGKRQPKFHQ